VSDERRGLTADILVVGAGPAGLALALQAHDHGAAVRVIDRRPEAARPSRALILHARTLEVLRPLGVTPALLARADTAPAADLRLGSRTVRVTLCGLALPDTAFPHLTLVRQMDVERVLASALAYRGVEVERGTELAAVRDEPGGARALLRTPTGSEQARFGFAVGCDGPASIVRAQAGLRWTGRIYPVEIVLADAELDGDLPGDAAQVVAGRGGLLFAFRLGERATWRLLGTRPATPGRLEPGSFGPPVSAIDLQQLIDAAGLDARVADLLWSSRVTVQRRVASRFRRGRLFLAGDAAHAYSPATGQGMNAAIQDAANLGWKLAFATSGPADGTLLESYDRERRPVARQLLALTDLAFWAEAGTGPIPSALRARLAPLIAQLGKSAAFPSSKNILRPEVRKWTLDELTPALDSVGTGRDLARGKRLYAEALCARCHRLRGEGLPIGPDLDGVASRFGRRDLLETIVVPSKVVDDKYRNLVIETDAGQVITGQLAGGDAVTLAIAPDPLEPTQIQRVSRKSIVTRKSSPVSIMPEGLLNTLDRDEILDLLSYLESVEP
jgi:putative heme-binding domain-containing protein